MTESRPKSLSQFWNSWRHSFEWHISFFSKHMACLIAFGGGELWEHTCICEASPHIIPNMLKYIHISHRNLLFAPKESWKAFSNFVFETMRQQVTHLINYWRSFLIDHAHWGTFQDEKMHSTNDFQALGWFLGCWIWWQSDNMLHFIHNKLGS